VGCRLGSCRAGGRKNSRVERFWIEWLPPYAPDLNPVEHVWNHTKYGHLANCIPADLLDLELELDWSMEQTRTRPELLRSFLHAAELEL
jgi:putative transposase